MPATRSRAALLGQLRERGVRGGVIGQHRAMATGHLSGGLVASAIIAPLALAALTVAALQPLGRLWGAGLEQLATWLALPGAMRWQDVGVGAFSFAVPGLTTVAPVPGTREFAIVLGLCAAVLVVTLLLPLRWLPLVYLLRFGILVQLTAVLVFVLRPDSFPYTLGDYLVSHFTIGSAVLVLVPVIFGFTLFPFRIPLWRKVALTLLTLVHLALLIPLQAAVHAWLVHQLSLLVMPPLFFLFGTLPQIFVLVALYAWGMSWPDRAEGGA